jgi:hypothetical protein
MFDDESGGTLEIRSFGSASYRAPIPVGTGDGNASDPRRICGCFGPDITPIALLDVQERITG